MEIFFKRTPNESSIPSRFKQSLKYFLILLITTIFSTEYLMAQNASKNITLELSNVTVEQAINQIEEKSDYHFLYNKDIVDVSQRVSLSVKNASINEVCKLLFTNTNISYILDQNQIVLNRKMNSESNNQIKGIVRDKTGLPIPGVSISIQGRQIGTVTDSEGRFTITVEDNDILLFSMLGYKSQNVTVQQAGSTAIILEEDSLMIEEVIAIGYGSIKKSDLTGAVTNVSSEKIMNLGKTNDPIQALQGQIAGADIISGNAPGSSSSIIIRGYNTLMRSGGDAPLIILDDAPFLGRLNDINPAEIEKIDILRDASSTAIYGARGANGVIIITTKRGSEDRVSFEYDGFFGIGKNYKDFDVMDGPTFAAYRKEAYLNNGITDPFDNIQNRVIENGNFVNWQRLLFNDWAIKTNHNITINNSSGLNRNMVVLGYNEDKGILDNMGYQRFTGRFTGDMELHKKFTFGYSVAIAHSNWDVGDPNVWRLGTRMDPVSEVYDPNTGELNFFTNKWMSDNSLPNPLYGINANDVDVRVIRNNIAGNLYANWTIINGLTYKTTFTYNFTNSDDGRYYAKKSTIGNNVRDHAVFVKTKEQQVSFSNILTFNKQLKESHKFNASLVHDMQKYESPLLRLQGYDMPYYGKWYNVNEAQQNLSYVSGLTEWSLLSFMGRLNYTFKERYLLTLTGRYDGSSRLAKGNKWDFFPSGAFAWRIIEEDFMKNADAISNLKLRISYGISGNTAVDTYATQGQYGRFPYAFGTSEVPAWGYVPSIISNPQLGWEKTSEWNLGLDFGFFNNRLSGNLDLYRRDTRDLLMERNLPSTSGYTSVWDNVGQIRNTGIEFSFHAVPVSRKDFTLAISGNFSYNKNEIVELFNGKEDSPANNWFIGEPVSVQRLYKYIGVWQESESDLAAEFKTIPGKPRFEDVDESKSLTTEDLFIYNRIPKYLAGLTISANWKQFDFSVYSYGRFDYGGTPGVYTYELGSTRFNQITQNFWTKDNPTNDFPRPEMVRMGELSASDFVWNDYSFVRVKNINLGYTLPESASRKIRSQQIRFYLAIDNPFLFTNSSYVGLDPENSNSEADARPLTTYLIGLNMKF